MNTKILIASVLGLSTAGVGGYFVVTHDVSIVVNVSPEGSQSTVATDDFRKLIPNYENLSLADKARSIREIYDALPAEQKIAANREKSALADELRERSRKNFGKVKSEGYVPQGWED